MILTARLFIKGDATEKEGIPLSYCQYDFTQEIDQRGLPVSSVRGGVIHLSYSSFDDSDIVQWMMSPESDKNGSIEFSGVESSKAFKTVDFMDARCVGYRETFNRDDEMLVELTISARQIVVGGMDHYNIWSGYDQ